MAHGVLAMTRPLTDPVWLGTSVTTTTERTVEGTCEAIDLEPGDRVLFEPLGAVAFTVEDALPDPDDPSFVVVLERYTGGHRRCAFDDRFRVRRTITEVTESTRGSVGAT